MGINCELDGDSCKVRNAEITKPGQAIKAFKDIEQLDKSNGKGNGNIRNLGFFNAAQIQYFPRNLQNSFPNLVELQITNSGIKEISRQDLRGLENLRVIEMENGLLTTLSDDLFLDMKNLLIVKFTNNRIELTSSKVLEPLVGTDILSVKLLGNKNIDAWYSLHSFQGSTHKSLQELMNSIDEKCSKPVKH